MNDKLDNKNKALDYLSNFRDKKEALIEMNKHRDSVISLYGSLEKAYERSISLVNLDKIITELKNLKE